MTRRAGQRKPVLLDLFCCAGGAAMGYHRAGFDVVGVDAVWQWNYPFPFICADAMELDQEWMATFDAIHASPPCQHYSVLAKRTGCGDLWPDLIGDLRDKLKRTGIPYVIENVVGSPLRDHITLCGTMFSGLRVIRHRLFESNILLSTPARAVHRDRFATPSTSGRTTTEKRTKWRISCRSTVAEIARSRRRRTRWA